MVSLKSYSNNFTEWFSMSSRVSMMCVWVHEEMTGAQVCQGLLKPFCLNKSYLPLLERLSVWIKITCFYYALLFDLEIPER